MVRQFDFYNLYMFNSVNSILQDVFKQHGKLRQWYKQSSVEICQDQATGLCEYEDVYWFLTENTIVKAAINPTGIYLRIFMLKEITSVEKHYKFKKKGTQEYGELKLITLNFKDNTIVKLEKPVRTVEKNAYYKLGNFL